jgi:hypothetical protein
MYNSLLEVLARDVDDVLERIATAWTAAIAHESDRATSGTSDVPA